MKKNILIIFILSFIILGILGLIHFSPVFFHHNARSENNLILNNNITRKDYSVELIQTSDDYGNYVSFIIKRIDGTSWYDPNDLWRTFDLKYIGLIGDSNDVLVISGDTGNVLYKYYGGTWHLSTYHDNYYFEHLSLNDTLFASSDFWSEYHKKTEDG